jgi:hypothetical protein
MCPGDAWSQCGAWWFQCSNVGKCSLLWSSQLDWKMSPGGWRPWHGVLRDCNAPGWYLMLMPSCNYRCKSWRLFDMLEPGTLFWCYVSGQMHCNKNSSSVSMLSPCFCFCFWFTTLNLYGTLVCFAMQSGIRGFVPRTLKMKLQFIFNILKTV